MDITEKDRIDDQGNKVKPLLTDEQFCILYAICHVTGMLSACANPVIYGYLNENFNKEFKDILAVFNRKTRSSCCQKRPVSGELIIICIFGSESGFLE